ncbi:hypothetical protein KSP40_PGU014605 [Platanthera guangdongensis]|uniref:Uncharacterized protein n=1 Tax=Platanthera guangdongensis TaxID=2320717 RepID=A0ABR2M3L0_9ASPA
MATIISSNMTSLHNPFLTCSNLLSNRSRAAGRTNSAPHHLSVPVSQSPSSQDPSLKSTVNKKKPFLWKDFSKLPLSNCHQNDYRQVLRNSASPGLEKTRALLPKFFHSGGKKVGPRSKRKLIY